MCGPKFRMELDENERRLMRGAGWGMWAFGWLAPLALGALLGFASIMIGINEPLAARPFFLAALVCVLGAGAVFAAGIGRALVRGRKLD